jgi:hypothetical protein
VQKAIHKAKRPSSDPTPRAPQTSEEPGRPPVKLIAFDPTADFNTLMSTYMAQIGAKGGKVSGAKRMQMPEEKRKAIARKAAAARWAKK